MYVAAGTVSPSVSEAALEPNSNATGDSTAPLTAATSKRSRSARPCFNSTSLGAASEPTNSSGTFSGLDTSLDCLGPRLLIETNDRAIQLEITEGLEPQPSRPEFSKRLVAAKLRFSNNQIGRVVIKEFPPNGIFRGTVTRCTLPYFFVEYEVSVLC